MGIWRGRKDENGPRSDGVPKTMLQIESACFALYSGNVQRTADSMAAVERCAAAPVLVGSHLFARTELFFEANAEALSVGTADE